MRAMAGVVLLLALTAGCASGQGLTLEARLRAKLEASAREPLVVESMVESCWPRVQFVRARREGLAGGEDPRPALVGATSVPGDTVISSSWEDLPSVWRLVRESTTMLAQSDSGAVECILQLLNGSAVLPRVRLLRSSEQAIASSLTWSSRDTAALRRVGPPALRRLDKSAVLTLYSRENGGVYRVQISISSDTLSFERSAVARTVLNY